MIKRLRKELIGTCLDIVSVKMTDKQKSAFLAKGVKETLRKDPDFRDFLVELSTHDMSRTKGPRDHNIAARWLLDLDDTCTDLRYYRGLPGVSELQKKIQRMTGENVISTM